MERVLRRQMRFTVLMAIATLGFACTSDSLAPLSPAASIEAFSADPDALVGPGTTTISWRTENAAALTLRQNGAVLDLGDRSLDEGSLDVAVTETSVFELVAEGARGAQVSSSVTVTVTSPAPTIGSFVATEVVERDELGQATTTVSWSGVVGATELRLESDTLETQSLAVSPGEGSLGVVISRSTQFRLVAVNEGGSVEAIAATRVVELPRIEVFAPVRSWVGLGDELGLRWQTSGAVALELWRDGMRVQGFEDAPLSGTITQTAVMDVSFELVATNELGTEVRETADVIVASPVIDSFEGGRDARWLGSPVELSWTTLGGRSVEVFVGADETPICFSQDLDAVDASGCIHEIDEVGRYDFRLTVTNGSGSASRIWSTEVGSGPVISSFTASPGVASLGDAITFAWTTLPDPDGEIPTLSITGGDGATPAVAGAAGEVDVTPATPGIHVYTLRAVTSHPGSVAAEAQATVTVYGLPEVELTATPLQFDDALVEDVTFSWTSSNTESLVLFRLADGEPAETLLVVPTADLASGEFRYVPTDDASYQILATNGAGAISTDEVTVTLAPPRILSFTADRSEITAGQPVVLSWNTEMARDVSLSVFGKAYLREETHDTYVDAQELGGTHLPMSADCGTSIVTTACVALDFPGVFTFPFDGIDRTRVRIYQSGVVSFDHAVIPTSPQGNVTLPTTAENKAFAHLMPFWDALVWDEERYPNGNLHYLYRPDPAGDSFVIQWKDISLTGTTYIPYTTLNFEVILWANGDFEYRYGEMESVAPNDPNSQRYADGGIATIGYQIPDPNAYVPEYTGPIFGSYDLINYHSTVTPRGPLRDRTFRYRVLPILPKSGTFTLHPFATADLNSITLTASRGDAQVTRSLDVTVLQSPVLRINQKPTEPVVAGGNVRIGWLTEHANRVEVFNGSGVEQCVVTAPLAVAESFCDAQEAVQGTHHYTVRVVGAHGRTTERVIPVTVFEDFGITSFESDQESVESGHGLTLSWVTHNTASISLTANGVELLSPSTDPGPGSLVVPKIDVDTTFVLRVTNSMGMVREDTVSVALWTISLDVQASTTSIRPGDPITVTIAAASLDGSPAPKVFGTFPLLEVTGPTHAFTNIAGTPGATDLMMAANAQRVRYDVALPPGFTFSHYGKEHTKLEVWSNGYVSFNEGTTATYSTNPLPNRSSPSNNVHLAPFWADLHSRGAGSLWTAQVDDTFIIQWTAMSIYLGSTTAAPHSMNFQLVLFNDGAFEFRYGEMKPQAPPATSSSCFPNTCVNEVNGSTAVIGYQNHSGTAGLMIHAGGPYASSPDAKPFEGGLSNRSFRFEPLAGSGTVSMNPTLPGRYEFCAMSGSRPVCREFTLTTDFAIESFEASSNLIGLGESATLSWKTKGGKELVIRDAEGVVYSTEILSEIDQGSFVVTPGLNTSYVLELRAPRNSTSASVAIEVVRLDLTATATPAPSFPGEPVTLSWNLNVRDPTFQPVMVTPMEEVTGPGITFSDMDISLDPRATVIHEVTTNASGNPVYAQNSIKQHDFESGFTFSFLGQVRTGVRISTDGFLSFAASGNNSGANSPLPSTTGVAGTVHIAPFWDDLHSRMNGKVLAMSKDEDTYVIQWSQMSLANGSSNDDPGSLNFLVVLRRNGDFEFRYGAMIEMNEPASSTTACYPAKCYNETNGAAATIGYQDPSGLAASMIHFGGQNRSPAQFPVPGGLTHRTWRYTRTTASGSVRIAPWNTMDHTICAVSAANGDVFCADPVEVNVDWVIRSFEAAPSLVLGGDPVSITWDVSGLDWLRLTANGAELESYTRANMPLAGLVVDNPMVATTYRLEASSLGRVISAEKHVEVRTFNLLIQEPTGRLFPGDTVTISWELEQLQPGPFAVAHEMIEVTDGPGFVDISGFPDVSEPALPQGSGAGASGVVDLPFPFPYFGASYDEVRLYVYGYLSFTTGVTTGRATNLTFPTDTADQHVHLAPFWDQMFKRGADRILTATMGPDTFVVQYTNFNRAGGSGAGDPARLYDLNFQVLLHRDGSFEYRYGKMDPPSAGSTSCYPNTCEEEGNGSSATIGYQLVDGAYGYTFHWGGNGAANVVPLPGKLRNRTLRFQPKKIGATEVKIEGSREVAICGAVGIFSECKSVFLQAVADPGDLVISELMIKPAAGSAQWFELRNLSKRFIDLEGFDIVTNTGTHKITGPLQVGAGEYITLAAGAVDGFTPDYVYGATLPMDMMVETLRVSAGTSTIASVTWGASWTDIPVGRSLFLDPSVHTQGVIANDSWNVWCPDAAAGTPGARSVGCIDSIYDVETYSTMPFIDIASMGTRVSDVENTYGLVELPILGYEIPFFGGKVDKYWVSALGFISFADEYPSGSGTYSPFSLPRPELTGSSPNVPHGPLVAVFWAQLGCAPAQYPCSFHYFHGEVDSKEVAIFQWSGYRWNNVPGELNFQAQLWKDGTIVIAFADVNTDSFVGSTNWNNYRGALSWVGLEDRDRTRFISGHHRQNTEMGHRTFHFMRK